MSIEEMRRRLLILLVSLPCALMAQSDLLFEGKVVAHDVDSRGPMPAALKSLLSERIDASGDANIRIVSRDYSHSPSRRVVRRQPKDYAPAEPVEPLLPSIRAQEEPYNLFCPYYTFDDGTVNPTRCLSGCVATSLEQILAYYRYPEALLDTLHGWDNGHYALDDLLPGTRFDWDNYLTDYRKGWTQAQGEAIALTTLAAGMAVHMNYGPHSSGANTYNAVEPLRRAFGYGMVEYADRIFYTPSRWHAILRHELEEGRPIVYAGHNMDIGGHAFNIDGVDAAGFYHVNWGYNGSYDGWYDLDWLSPFEPTDHPDDGFVIGFFCNQSALFMHPSEEAKTIEPDTLDIDSLGVELESLSLTRQADLQGRIAADFQFVNHSADSVTYTYEVMTWLPTDTAIFYQADYVGLAGLTLAPGERRVQRTYLNFSVAGERFIGISHDDVTIPFSQPITIVEGTPGKLTWGEPTYELSEDGESVTFTACVTNHATSGYASDLVTYCLYTEGHEDEDLRHYEVLSLPAGESKDVVMSFRNLLPGQHYTMLLRCPWKVQGQLDFNTPLPVGVSIVEGCDAPSSLYQGATFDVSGRNITRGSSRFFIRQGKKYVDRGSH